MPLGDLPTKEPDELVTVVPEMDDSFDDNKLGITELPGIDDPVTMHSTELAALNYVDYLTYKLDTGNISINIYIYIYIYIY